MAWNEPGNNGNGNDKNPWGGGQRGGDKGPPDIDEVIKNLTKKFGGLFGGSGSGSGNTGTSAGGGGLSGGLIAGLVVAAVVIWGFMGIYQVDQAARGVVLSTAISPTSSLDPARLMTVSWSPSPITTSASPSRMT